MVETQLTVKAKEWLTRDVFKLSLYSPQSEVINAGQFINIQVPNRKDLILKRPFGISSFDKTHRQFTVCIQVRGDGTQELSKVEAGDTLQATFPLGNGFRINGNQQKIAIVGGGIGVFPMLSLLCKYPEKKFYSFLGFKDKDNTYLVDEFEKYSEKVFIATDDGSLDYKGFCTDRLRSQLDKIKPDLVLACGPKNMFKSLKKVMSEHPNIPTFISMEERMGCGFGACLVCTCKVQAKNGDIKNRRVCADGPVFNIDEVVLDE